MKCGKTPTNKHPYLTTNNPTVFPMVFVYFLSLRVAPFKSHGKKKAASPVGRSDQDVVEALSQRLLEVVRLGLELTGKTQRGEKCFYPE